MKLYDFSLFYLLLTIIIFFVQIKKYKNLIRFQKKNNFFLLSLFLNLI